MLVVEVDVVSVEVVHLHVSHITGQIPTTMATRSALSMPDTLQNVAFQALQLKGSGLPLHVGSNSSLVPAARDIPMYASTHDPSTSST